MPVNTRHYEFEKAYPRIELTEAAVEGSVRREEFVPRLTGQSQAAWEAYVKRAAYYNVTERSLLALVGALLRKPYSMSGLVGDEPVVDDTHFEEFLQRAYRTLLVQGRLGLHVDYDEERGSPKLIAYSAEHVINWCNDFIVIEESVIEKDKDDPFVVKSVPQWRELRINEAGQYEVRLWRQTGRDRFEIIDTRVPLVRGAALSEIPFWFVTPYDNSTEVYTPPLAGLAELNVQHFRTSVDHGHGLHFTALPQPYIAGDLQLADPNNPVLKLAIGTDQVWHLTAGSTVGYLEFSGSGLGAIKEHIQHLEEQMYSAGSRLLTVKRGVESAEALQLRAGSESAVLITMALALEHGLIAALTMYNNWAGSSTVPTVELNKDFTAAQVDPTEMKSLLEAYAAGALTLESLLKRLYDGELIEDVETELAALAANPPAPEPTVVTGVNQ
jgi:hypothetical protein